jgi:hypothetical protein
VADHEKTLFPYGASVLNKAGAPFDSFIFLETSPGTPLLLAFQMKFSDKDSDNPKVLNDAAIHKEHRKISRSITRGISTDTGFVSVIMGHCKGTFTADKIPENCIVISKNEQKSFYGRWFFQRLNMK